MKKHDVELMLNNDYQKRHTYHFEEYLINLQNLFKIPEIEQKDYEIRNLKVDIAHKKYEKEDCALEEQKFKKSQQDFVNLLEKYNFDKNLAFPKYDCPVCCDLGSLNSEKCPNCYNKNFLKKLIDLCGTNLKNIPFLENIDTKVYGEKENEMIDIIEKLKKVLTTDKINTIVLLGKTGTGKTFISKSFLKSYLIKFNISKFITAFSLTSALIPNEDNNFGMTPMQDFIDYDLLVIDDLGAEANIKNNPARLLTLLNERQEQNKLTIITSNLTLSALSERYSERLFSRLLDKNQSLVFNFDGKDLRLKK